MRLTCKRKAKEKQENNHYVVKNIDKHQKLTKIFSIILYRNLERKLRKKKTLLLN